MESKLEKMTRVSKQDFFVPQVCLLQPPVLPNKCPVAPFPHSISAPPTSGVRCWGPPWSCPCLMGRTGRENMCWGELGAP